MPADEIVRQLEAIRLLETPVERLAFDGALRVGEGEETPLAKRAKAARERVEGGRKRR